MSRTHPHPSSVETNDIARLRRDVSLSSTVTQYGHKLSRNGRELETCCPFHAEDTPSFKIFIAHDGVERFHCFGCGKQGDVLDFVREVKGVDLPEAIRILGGIGSRPNARPREVKARDPYEGITALPPPADLLQAGRPVRLYNPKRRGGRSEWGSFAPSMVFPYRNADGSLLGYVLRHDLVDGAKETPMVMFARLADGTQTWCRLPFPKPRPLYGLQDIGEKEVIIVEGEKCRDRLSMASGRAVVSWAGGTQGVKHTDWSPLSGRDVLIWPDFDPPGMAAANEIARQLTSLGARIRLAGFADPDAASAPECYRFEDWRAGLFPGRGWDCADALDDGWTQAEIDAFMQETIRPFALPGAEDEKPVTAQRAGRASRRKAVVRDMPSQTREGDGRPRLVFHEADLSEVVTSACRLVVDAGARLYARDTALFQAVRVAGKEKTVLVPADEAALIDILSKHVLWLKPDERRKLGYRDISCPALVARSIIARHGDWPFPQIRAIVSLPMMRSDGTIINAQGFDRQSGILFESDKTWPEIPECPDRAAAVTALESIRKLIASFPFVSGVDESAALAMILTAIIRPSLKTAPLFGVNATAPGTGKSKLVDVAAILATGRLAAVNSHAGDDSELRKVLESRLLHGDSFINLDNLSVPLRSDHLCQVLSQEEVNIRPLGHTLSLDSATAAMFCATGNGLRFAGDLTRRVVLINLDAGVERPEERVFASDVVEDARRQRVEIVTSALTLLRAFVANEADKVSPALGSFEQWSNLVRSALVWLGLPDPLGNAAKIRDNDPEKERTSAIIAALPVGKPWAAADIARMVDEGAFDPVGNRRHEGLVEALGEFIEYGKLNTTRFSGFLRKNCGRIVDGQMIVGAGKNRANAVLWQVQTAGKS
ncbi:CHC2 zinc finger domain-containing protein [Rhizobium sp. BK377]|uniref:CHC2 zinc finger domain-containing protein n=1 Tax=Rhizobium sp. BK377 TaxID=2587058 RepID=UPI00160AA646|nr:CHC2 zinc finger domain-containing protein [Rhizobium sp. BK377]MBB3460986.1 putative DNA primase/helicase [Rhizobium sp. BK377]